VAAPLALGDRPLIPELGTVHILVVDDNTVDQEAVIRALKKQRIANPVVVARDGIEALEILEGSVDAEGVERPPLPRPNLVLLDLNMPRMNGIEFLEVLRKHPKLRDTIVFVLTTSRTDEDRVGAYAFNVAGYVVKSDVGEGFVRLLTLLDTYWRIVEFPDGTRG
jgi:CheY-like chemotaxis protein